MSFDPPSLRDFLAGLISIVIAITVHEFAHAYAADRAGDNTPRANGRISLNPLDHFDPVGGMMILFTLIAGFGIGWGKPVMINPYNFRHPRWDNLRVSLWGPLSNLLLALAIGLLIRFGLLAHANESLQDLTVTLVFLNIALALFNLIPVPPLDGSHIFESLLPYEQARNYGRFMGQYGLIILIILLMTHVVGIIISGPSRTLFRLFTGLY